jgi:hypothetical protein
MWLLFQYGGVSSGNLTEFLVAIVALFGIPIAVLIAGRLLEKFF